MGGCNLDLIPLAASEQSSDAYLLHKRIVSCFSNLL